METGDTSGQDSGDVVVKEQDKIIPRIKYEYLDHPADIQLHSWGGDLSEAYEQVVMAMFGYMTDINTVDMMMYQEIEVSGHDLESLLFEFMSEFLFYFGTEPYFIPRVVKILEFDRENFTIKARGVGEPFKLGKHPQGTEVKAITYSNMQVHESGDRHEIYVIVDI